MIKYSIKKNNFLPFWRYIFCLLTYRKVGFAMNQNDIKNQMKVLVGATGFTIGHAASMAWMGFNIGGFQYALYLQTAFRICTDEKILIVNIE
jgi:hypothetical protein